MSSSGNPLDPEDPRPAEAELSPILSALPPSSPLRRYGYQVVAHDGGPEGFRDLRDRFAAILAERLAAFARRGVSAFPLERYAEVVRQVGVDHVSFLRETRRQLPAELLDHPHLRRLVELAGASIGRALHVYNDVLEYRACRPNQPDFNPWHRDSWFPGFKVLINVYLPLAGSHCDSALQVVPTSHLWSDEDCVPSFEFSERHFGAGSTRKGALHFNVPEIATCRHELLGHRPDIVPGDFMIFPAFTVHGCGSNASPETRFSFEFRLEVNAAPGRS